MGSSDTENVVALSRLYLPALVLENKGGKWCVPCRSLLDTEDELCNIQWDSMPVDVREWLTGTFAKKKNPYRNNLEETASVRAISYTVHTGVSVERKFRANTSSVGMAYSLEVVQAFKDVDNWDFNVFTLNEASGGHGLTCIMCELFSKYDLLSHFKIPLTCLVSFAKALEVGYNKYQNPYHNSVHATDVTQTVHSIMLHTGIMHKFTDLEILAIFFSTSIHDYEHTGTTNHFHVETRSETALLYNDKSVLENHHVSAAYHLMENADMNILASLTKDEWRELRRLVIMMVLSTDMSYHFQQMNSSPGGEHKDKIMSMIVHVADISHPAKPWVLHEQWARALMEEFFKQGDREAALGLQISSLCDRQTTNIAESQIGDVHLRVVSSLTLPAGRAILYVGGREMILHRATATVTVRVLPASSQGRKPSSSSSSSIYDATPLQNSLFNGQWLLATWLVVDLHPDPQNILWVNLGPHSRQAALLVEFHSADDAALPTHPNPPETLTRVKITP
uniref:Phosphodiesterase n=1 Tax=Varanus komodoensis TaxID=61221 RepID=A0A8D2Q4A8_VARKO